VVKENEIDLVWPSSQPLFALSQAGFWDRTGMKNVWPT
jgi:hypothetical protein